MNTYSAPTEISLSQIRVTSSELLTLRERYQNFGVASTKSLCDPSIGRSLAKKMLALADRRGIVRDRLFNDPDTGGTTIHKDVIVSTSDILDAAPEVDILYNTSRALIQGIVGREVIGSPFEDSRITLKLYRGTGAEHGWHNDTNSVSGIFALTDNLGDAPLVYCCRGTKIVAGSEYCEEGKLIVLKGHDIWHRVQPIENPETVRMTLIMNYYHPGEERRLSGFDSAYYSE
jgi:hypothetical protein